jgi:ubiquinone/menaquinone biosynthesis C-methylase UbiE
MKKINTPFELISDEFSFKNKVVIDVGCGTGDIVRRLASQGAVVTGIDVPKMIEKARKHGLPNNVKYHKASAEKIPVRDNYADILLYIASFHHVPEGKMQNALVECKRILKTGGKALFVEPVVRPGSYYEITGLVEDEKKWYAKAYDIIKSSVELGFKIESEDYYYIERSFSDYIDLLNNFVDDCQQREKVIKKARKITEKFSKEAGKDFEEFRYKSIIRKNILEKIV